MCLLSRQLTRAGEYELTAAVCDQAAAIQRELGDQTGLCENLIVQALALNVLGLSEDALEALNVAHEVANQLNDKNLQYWVINRIAVVHTGMHDYARARDFQLRALDLVDDLDEDAQFCIVNNYSDNSIGLSRQIRATGDWATADRTVQDGLEYAEAALDMAVTARNPYREVLALDNSAMLLALAGDHAGALQRLETGLRIAAEGGFHSLELSARCHQATVLLLQDRMLERCRSWRPP